MSRRLSMFQLPLAAALAALTAIGAPADPAAAQDRPVAFVGVNVVPMDEERVLENQTVLVRDGRIAAIGPAGSTPVPDDALRVDGEDRFLMPGIAEMHAHIPGANAPEQLIRDIMFLYVANGVTVIRGMLGAPNQLALRERTAAGEVLGPTIFVGAPSLNGNSAPDPATARRLVREHHAAGYDFLKLHPGLSREVYDATVEAAREVGITFAGHISQGVGLERTLEARQSTIDHLDGYVEASLADEVRARAATGPVSLGEMMRAFDEDRLHHWARATREAGVWNVPTAHLWESFYTLADPEEMAASKPEMRYAPPQMVRGWINQKRNQLEGQAASGMTEEDRERLLAARRTVLAALGEAGAGLLMGTDSPQMFNVPGFAVHREIALMQEVGLSPYLILESGTRNVATYAEQDLGLDGRFGTVSVGNRADLIMLESNPLEDARRVAERAGVMVRGTWLPESEIQQRLSGMAERFAAQAEGGDGGEGR